MTASDRPLVLDERGRRCPWPVISLGRAISEVPVGAILEVLSDDPAAATDIPAWCGMRGHDFLGVSASVDVSEPVEPPDSLGPARRYRVRRRV